MQQHAERVNKHMKMHLISLDSYKNIYFHTTMEHHDTPSKTDKFMG